MSFGVFQFRRGTAAAWTAANTVLAAGELGLESDTSKFKVGDGTTAWNSLAYGGIQGTTGATGPGVVAGGTTGQALTKNSATNYDTGWTTVVKSGDTAGGDLTGTYPSPTIRTSLNDPSAATPGLRTLGTGASQATAGNDSRLSDSRAPTGSASGDLTGTYPGPTVAVDSITNPKLVNMTAPAIKGRVTAGTGDPEDLTVTQVTAMLNPATTLLQGVMTAVDKKRTMAYYDAVADFGFVGDYISTLGTTTVTGTAMTDSTNPFTPADVGKRVVVPYAGAGTTPNIAQLTTTIAAYVSANQVTLAAGATNNVTAASVGYGTDNSVAEALMVSTINNQAYSGATIIFGRSATNAYGVQTSWVFSRTCQIEGIGGGHTTDTGTYPTMGGTRLAWWGTSSDGGTAFQAMINFVPTGVQNLKKTAIRHLWIDCWNNGQNQALYGLKLVSCAGHMIEDFYVRDPLAQAIWMDIGSTPTEAKDTTRFSHRDLCVRCIDTTATATTTPTTTTSALTWSTSGQSMVLAAANNLRTAGYVWVESNLGYPVLVRYTGGGGTTTLTGCTVATEDTVNAPASYSGAFVVEAACSNGGAYKLNGAVGADTCCGVIEVLQVSHGTTWGPAGMEFCNSDSVVVRNAFFNGGNNTTETGGNRQRKPGIRFNCSNTNSGLASRNNTLYDIDPSAGGISVMGVSNAGTALAWPAGPIRVHNYNMANGAPIPIVEAGSVLNWTANGSLSTSDTGPLVITTTTANATATIIARIPLPPQAMQVGLTVRCRFSMSKTAAGIAARITGVKIGTTGTVSDTTVNSASRTPTAAVDKGVEEIVFSIAGPLGASCTSVMTSTLIKGLVTATGLSNLAVATDLVTGTPVTFNSGTGPPSWLSFFVTPGASEVITISPPVLVEVLKGASP